MERIDIDAPVREATLLEDRAQVLRSGGATLPAGLVELVVSGVAPVLADKTVTVRVPGSRVVGVRVEREQRVSPVDPRRGDAAAQDRLRVAEREVERLAEAMARAERTRELLAGCAEQLASDIDQDAAAGRADPEGWNAAAEQLAAQQTAAALEAVALGERHALAHLAVADLRHQAHVAGAGPVHLAARLLITVDAVAGPAEVHIAYVVPGACWRPWHRARMQGGTVEFTSEACVWQRCGEDWTDVRLRLSTDRPSLGVEPPRLSEDPLTLRAKDRAVVVEVRDQAVETTRGSGGRAVAEMPGIDDGGEVRVLAVQGSATVPSDGSPHRFPLFAFTAPAQAELLVQGELAAAAVLKTVQANAAAQPLLAGPVDLIRNGGLVGRTSILYVAPGAQFTLGWGPDAAVRVRRNAWTQEEKAGLLSGWTPQLHLVDLAFSNLSGEARTLRVVERIPVSELQQVKVELDAAATLPKTAPDADGMCAWTVTLPPRGHGEVTLRWRLLKQGVVAGV